MHAQRCARERAADRIGIGQGLQEVAAARPEHVDLAAPGGLDHLRRGETTMRGNVEAVARSSRDVAASTARSSSKPTVCSRTNASSTPPSSIRIFKVPRTNARSPPVWMEKNASAIFVPKIALSTLEGTQ